jgi:hypothetical protein
MNVFPVPSCGQDRVYALFKERRRKSGSAGNPRNSTGNRGSGAPGSVAGETDLVRHDELFMVGYGRSYWLRGLDLNQRPLGYEPNELPDCSTPHLDSNNPSPHGQTTPTGVASACTRIQIFSGGA